MASFNIYSNCSTLEVGCYVYIDPEFTTILPSTLFADGYYSYVTDSNGIIISKDICIHS